jgi:hypothetical protein
LLLSTAATLVGSVVTGARDAAAWSVIFASGPTAVSVTLPGGCNFFVVGTFAGAQCCTHGPGGGSGAGGCTYTVGQCQGHNISHVDYVVC